MTLKPHEMYLTAACYETNTADRCKEALYNIRELRMGIMSGEEHSDYLDAADHMLAKGHLFLLEGKA